MAITSQTSLRVGPNSYIVTVTSGLADPTFYWYQDGVLVESSERASRHFDIFDGDVDVQVFDDAGTAPTPVYPRKATVQWQGTGATRYRVALSADPFSSETDLATIFDIGDSPIMSYTTESLDTGKYRILAYPIDEYGNEGFPITFEFTVRGAGGEATVVEIDYDSGTSTLTASAAA